MNYQDPPLHGQAKNVTYDNESAAEKDARLQADPELASSEGRATLPALAIYFTAMVFVVCVVLWGLNHQRDETVTNAAAPATEAPANQPQSQSPPPKQQSQDNQQPAQPQQNADKPAAQQNQPANAQQQKTPAPKQ